REVDLIVHHHDVGEPELVEMRGFRHRAARLVHVGAGQQQQRALAAERPLRRHALKASPPRADAMALGDRVDRHETDIVSVAGVARTGIAEPDEEQHGILSVRSCPRTRASSNLEPRDRTDPVSIAVMTESPAPEPVKKSPNRTILNRAAGRCYPTCPLPLRERAQWSYQDSNGGGVSPPTTPHPFSFVARPSCPLPQARKGRGRSDEHRACRAYFFTATCTGDDRRVRLFFLRGRGLLLRCSGGGSGGSAGSSTRSTRGRSRARRGAPGPGLGRDARLRGGGRRRGRRRLRRRPSPPPPAPPPAR